MKLTDHPRITGVLCAAVVLLCAAAPAGFLALTDAAYFGTVETVADPYVAPTPTAEDYYILRQLNARAADSASRPQTEHEPGAGAPKVYVGASATMGSMNYANTDTTTAAETALRQLAESGVVPAPWVEQALTPAEPGDFYTDYNGTRYDLSGAYCATDSLGFVTVRRFARQNGDLFTQYSITLDSRTGTVAEVWLSMPAADVEATETPDADALYAFAVQAGLQSLGDWQDLAGSPYTAALYSANGQALITASAHPYAYKTYTSGTATDRWYYSLTLQPCAPDQLPG